METPLQTHLPYDPAHPRPLPGISPLDMRDWLLLDEAYAGQMGERDRLLADQRAQVLREDARARPAATELLALVLDQLRAGHPAGFDVAPDRVRRPDGVTIAIDDTDPLGTLGRLVQEDLCLLERCESTGEHVLTAAVLCFPASWMLDEKFLRPLTVIHVPVARYDSNTAARVQRLFDGIQPDRPLWRFNALWYADPALHQPRSEGARRPERSAETAEYLRSERQCLVRLPKTRAVVFSIHTYVVPRGALTAPDDRPTGG